MSSIADAMGLRDRTIFSRYAIRNALLPQVTALALTLGRIVGGAVLVEVIFGYPGIGTVLYQGIRGSDFYRGSGHHLRRHRLHRSGDLDPRHRLSAAGPADHLSEGHNMSTSVERSERRAQAVEENSPRARLDAVVRYFRRNPSLAVGLDPVFLACSFPPILAGCSSISNRRDPCQCRLCSRRPGNCPSAATSRDAICLPSWSWARR